jgi:hypothetical protein
VNVELFLHLVENWLHELAVLQALSLYPLLLDLFDLSRAHHLQELCWYDYLVLGIRLTVQVKSPEWRILRVAALKVYTSPNLQLAFCNLDAKSVVFFFEV